jgi:hypothetical protein
LNNDEDDEKPNCLDYDLIISKDVLLSIVFEEWKKKGKS